MLLFGCMDACVYVYACLCRCVYACRSECMCVCSCVRVCVSQVQGHSDLRALRSGLSCLEYSQADVYLQAHAPSHQVKRPLSLPHVQPSPPLFLTSSFYSLLFSSSCLHVSILFFFPLLHYKPSSNLFFLNLTWIRPPPPQFSGISKLLFHGFVPLSTSGP